MLETSDSLSTTLTTNIQLNQAVNFQVIWPGSLFGCRSGYFVSKVRVHTMNHITPESGFSTLGMSVSLLEPMSMPFLMKYLSSLYTSCNCE